MRAFHGQTEIRSLGLDMQNWRGQDYDMAGNMGGKYQRIQREYPLALYVHCTSHRLNLCIVKSCEILLVKTLMDKVKLVADFFNNSPKRQQALETNIRDLLGSGTRQKKMIDVCRRRWVEHISRLKLRHNNWTKFCSTAKFCYYLSTDVFCR